MKLLQALRRSMLKILELGKRNQVVWRFILEKKFADIMNCVSSLCTTTCILSDIM